MSLHELRQRCGREWPAIAKAQKESETRLDQVRQVVLRGDDGVPIDSEDISVVVFGSLARGEWTGGSDLDWTLILDGGADHGHAHTARRFRESIERAQPRFKLPGPTGVFGTLTFSHDLIHLIGGEDDTNRNTTRRMLLLLESRPVHADGAYNRVVRGILNRYLENDFRAFRLKVPRFLQNDLHRFRRTMCVDYANKYRERAGLGWAIRIIKLRLSRKLMFAAGLLTCFSCHPEWVRETSPPLAENPTLAEQVEYLQRFVGRTALDITAEVIARRSNPETARLILDNYDRFLAVLDDDEKRKRLEELPPKGEEHDSVFQELIECSRIFESGLLRLFYDDNQLLATLTREYGIF